MPIFRDFSRHLQFTTLPTGISHIHPIHIRGMENGFGLMKHQEKMQRFTKGCRWLAKLLQGGKAGLPQMSSS